jgi:hypothetical protein
MYGTGIVADLHRDYPELKDDHRVSLWELGFDGVSMFKRRNHSCGVFTLRYAYVDPKHSRLPCHDSDLTAHKKPQQLHPLSLKRYLEIICFVFQHQCLVRTKHLKALPAGAMTFLDACGASRR